MNILTTLAQQFITDTNNDGTIDAGEVIASLTGLLASPQSPIDLGAIVSRMQQSGLGEVASSWLGDGENLPISAEQITGLFESNKLQSLASALNLDTGSVAGELSKIIPSLIDQSSSGGELRTGSDSPLEEMMSQFKNLL